MRVLGMRFTIRGVMIAVASDAAILAVRNELGRMRQRRIQEEIKQLVRSLAGHRSNYGARPVCRFTLPGDPTAASP